MKTKPMPTQEYLKQCLDYNPDTGVFTWRVRPIWHFSSSRIMKSTNTSFAGKNAGNEYKKGKKLYMRIRINGLNISSHRLAWLYVHGEIDCDLDIDHINGNGTDNRIDNLRLVSHVDNSRNCKLSKSNSSGANGVRFHKKSGRWSARIKVNYKSIHLGYYSSFDEAVSARKSADLNYNFHENHGSERDS